MSDETEVPAEPDPDEDELTDDEFGDANEDDVGEE